MTRQRADAVGCASGTRWESAPPALPADTRGKRLADRLTLRAMPMSRAYAVVFVVAVVGSLLASALPGRVGLAVYGATGVVVGGYCSMNFWRCRHAHCLITGPGYLAFSVLAFVETGLGHSIIGGYEAPVFLGVFVAAVAFEALWHARRGDNAVRAPGASRQGWSR